MPEKEEKEKRPEKRSQLEGVEREREREIEYATQCRVNLEQFNMLYVQTINE